MFLVDMLLSVLVNGLIGVKIALLATAVLLFVYGLATRKQPHKPTRRTKPMNKTEQRIDIHV